MITLNNFGLNISQQNTNKMTCGALGIFLLDENLMS